MASSPMKGIERLSEELRLERQKANHALQDRARLKVEIESLKQSMENQRHDYQDLQLQHDELKASFTSLSQQYAELDQLRHEQDETLSSLSKEREQIFTQYQHTLHEQESMIQSIQEMKEELAKEKIVQETSLKKLQSKEELIQHLKEELYLIRQQQVDSEQEKLSTFQQLHHSVAMNEELQTKLHMADAIETGYQQTKMSNEELRYELDKSIALNQSLNETIRELNTRLSDKSAMERSLNDQIKVLISERDEYSVLIKELDGNVEELTSQLQAESATRQALQEKAEFAVQNRHFVDEQLQIVREKYEEMKSEHLVLIENEIGYKRQLHLFEEENQTLLKQVSEMETMKEEMSRMSSLHAEIETLRSSLSHMRKRLIQRDLEEEAGVLTPQVILDREQQGRQVYEGIIQDLRLEIDRLNVKYHELQRKYDEVMLRAGRVDSLEEEVEMYKEMVKNLTAESQT
jgi:chromosome segregation ATPase